MPAPPVSIRRRDARGSMVFGMGLISGVAFWCSNKLASCDGFMFDG
jgi:hypothetical protein